MKASGSPDLFFKFKEMKEITKKHTHLSYIQHLKNLSMKLKTDPKLFWSFHAVKSKRKRIPEIVYYNGAHSTKSSNKGGTVKSIFSYSLFRPIFRKNIFH